MHGVKRKKRVIVKCIYISDMTCHHYLAVHSRRGGEAVCSVTD